MLLYFTSLLFSSKNAFWKKGLDFRNFFLVLAKNVVNEMVYLEEIDDGDLAKYAAL